MKKWGIFLLSIVLLISVAPKHVKAASFKDVSETHDFYEEIKYLSDKQVITGFSDGTFLPEKAVTRAEAAIMIGKAFKLDGTKRKTKFKDVDQGQTASGYIASAVEKGIITGYSNGTFKSGASINRGEMAIILSRAFDLSAESVFTFKDVGRSTAAFASIQELAAAAITAGYPDGTFRPNQNITRAQFSAFLSRGFEVSFKQKAAIKDSYTHDKTKQYTFKTSYNGIEQLTYKNVNVWEGMIKGYMWEVRSLDNNEVNYFAEYESYDGLAIAYPVSEYTIELTYPIKLGNTWHSFETTYKVTGIGKTVNTAYQTFTNAVEVTGYEGRKAYYVKHVGLVKVVDRTGKALYELIEIK